MKKVHSRVCMVLVVVILTQTCTAVAQKKSIAVESWEIRLNRLQPPEKIMDAIGLKPGMVIGDIGAGTGRFAVWFADRVGESGKVYVNDIDKGALNHLDRRCEMADIHNVVTVLGEIEDPHLPEKSLDIAFMINVYHHLDKPVELVRNIVPSLKPTGLLAIVECDPKKSGLPEEHSTPREEVLQQLDRAGFEVLRIETFLEQDNIFICRPKDSGKSED